MQTDIIPASTRQRLSTARARFWKRRVSPTLQDAIAECTAYALEAHNLSIERIAELMGLDGHWTLRKYISEVRLPAKLIPPFEHACGIDLVTRYLGSRGNRISIEIPTGRHANDVDTGNLQMAVADATATLLRFYHGEASADDTLAALNAGLQELGWHRTNVQKSQQPELPL